MDKKQLPEQQTGNTEENPVSFSDLGPLFAPEEPSAQEEEVIFDPLPQSPEPMQPEEDVFKPCGDLDDPQEEKIMFDPDRIVPFDEEPPETQTDPQPEVDFSDLGPLFSQQEPEPSEASPVIPGAAALLLKQLSEMPREESPQEQPLTEEGFEEFEEESYEDFSEDLSQHEEEDALYSQEDEVQQPLFEDPDQDIREEAPLSFEEPEALQQLPQNAAVPQDPDETDLDQVFEDAAENPQLPEDPSAAEPENEQPQNPRPLRKGRPKRKKGEGFFGIPNILVTAVWIAVTVLIGVTLGRMAWLCASDVLAFGKEDKLVTITIYEADTTEDIARKLHESGLIRYPGLFKLYASLAVDEGEIHPGIWDLNTRYDYHALVNMMSPSSSREVVELMIPEGYSCRQIFALMEENKICTSLDLASYAASGELDDYWFLEDVQRGDMYCLEGYLFPDTYQFYKNDSPKAVLTKMLDNFESKFDENMIGQIDTLNAHLAELMAEGGHGADYIAQNRFTVRDVINVASLIEKETSSAEEGYMIASVIYNRLYNWGKNVPYLNIDATIVYALGGKTKLTPEDLKVDSPYNTYTHTGLTPGPIANPGLASIKAALDPSDSDYYFYVLDPALGSHRFSTTYEEHKANIASIGG